VIVLRTGKKSGSSRDRYYDRKIKKFQSSVWKVCDRYYDRKKKSSSRLSSGCAIVITTGKKKLVVAALENFFSVLCCSCGVLFPGPRGTAQVAGGELDNLTGGCQRSQRPDGGGDGSCEDWLVGGDGGGQLKQRQLSNIIYYCM
jgi:hypothetical protein